MKYFLDTEFSDTGSVVHPISIGIVNENGDEYYTEISSPWRDTADPWILDNVGRYMGQMSARAPSYVRDDIIDYLGDEPAEFWAYWASYDWVVFCQLMGGLMKLPKHVSPWVRDLAWLAPIEQIRALNVENRFPHHAMHDAFELREQYRRLTEGKNEQLQEKSK